MDAGQARPSSIARLLPLRSGKDRLAVSESRAARSRLATASPGANAGAVTSPLLIRIYSGSDAGALAQRDGRKLPLGLGAEIAFLDERTFERRRSLDRGFGITG